MGSSPTWGTIDIYGSAPTNRPRLLGSIDRLRICLGSTVSSQTQAFVTASRSCEACVTPSSSSSISLRREWSNAEILDDCADLELDDLYAALEYGARASAVSRVVRLGAA